MRAASIAFVACALACGATSSLAERADRDKEIVVGADKLTADDNSRTSTFEGSVVVTQGTMRMTAAKVTVKEDADRHKYYVANGAPVTFRQKRDNVDEWIEGFAQRAEFDDRNDVLKLFNHATVKSNTNEITGEFISYDMNKAVAEVTGAAPGTAPPRSGELAPRVKVKILPAKRAPEEEKGKAGDKPAPAAGITLKPDTGTQ
jgi:lipopolysaccharide export system protein LptA